MCLADGVAITTNDNLSSFLSLSSQELAFPTDCRAVNVRYRPVFCPFHSSSCGDFNWSDISISNNSDHNSICGNGNRRTHGLFMNSELYQNLESNCL